MDYDCRLKKLLSYFAWNYLVCKQFLNPPTYLPILYNKGYLAFSSPPYGEGVRGRGQLVDQLIGLLADQLMPVTGLR